MLRIILCSVLGLFLNSAHGEATVSGAGLPVKNIFMEDNLPTKRTSSPDAHYETIDPFSGRLKINIPVLSWQGNGHLPINLSWSYRQGSPESRGIFVPRVKFSGRDENLCGIPAQHSRTEGFYQYDGLQPVIEMPDGSTFELYAKDSTFQSFISANQWRLTCSGPNTAQLDSPDGLSYRLDQKHIVEHQQTDYLPGYFSKCQVGNLNTCTEYGTTSSTFSYLSPSQIKAPNTESLSLSYQGGRLVQVSASDGRLVQLSYSGAILTGLRAGDRAWQFSGYASTNPQVVNEPDVVITNPDGTTWKVGFYQASRVPALRPLDMFVGIPNRLTTPQGGVINYEHGWQPYDVNAYANLNSPACLRVDASPTDKAQCKGIIKNALVGNALTSTAAVWKKTTSDGGVWVYSTYAPGADLFINRNSTTPLDIRKVIRPDGSSEITSYMNAADVPSCATDRWKIGLQKKSELLDQAGNVLQTTEFGWTSLVINNFGHHYLTLKTNDEMSCVGQQVRLPLNERKTTVRQGSSYSVQTSFDAFARPLTVLASGDGVNTWTQYAYETPASAWRLDRVKSETISPGSGQPAHSAIARSFDIYGNLLLENKNGVVTEYDNFPNGEVRSVKDPRGLVTTYDNYYRGVPQIEVKQLATGKEGPSCPANINSVTTNRTVDDFGNITSVKDPRGNTISYRYDNMSRPITVTPARGSATTIQWTPTSRTATRGGTTDYQSWDGFGRTNQTIVNGFITSSVIDSLGRKIYQSYPGTPNEGDSFTYDALGRVTKETHADGSYRSYSYQGSEVAITEERGVKTTYQYRAIGDPDEKKLVRVSPAIVNDTVIIERDILGKVTKVTQNNVSRTWSYDSKHYLVQRADPELGVTTFVNDPVGNVLTKQVNQLPATSFTYDGNNKLKSISFADQSAEPACLKYDENSNLIEQKTNSVTRSFEYDANNNPTKETLSTAGSTYSLQYEYDSNDFKTALVYPNGQRIELAPDLFGRPTKLGSFISGIKYNPRHQVLQYYSANGRNNVFEFTGRGWPKSQKLALINDQVPQEPVAPVPPAPFNQTPPTAPTPPAPLAFPEPGATMSADTACRALYREPLLSDFSGLNGAADRYRAAFATWQSEMAGCTTNWNQRGVVWSDGQAGCRAANPAPLPSQFVRPEQYQSALNTWTNTKLNPCLADWRPKAAAWATYRGQVNTYNQQNQQYQTNLSNYNQSLQQHQQATVAYNQAKAKYDQDLAAYKASVASRLLVDTNYSFDGVGNLKEIRDNVYPKWNRVNRYDEVDRLVVSDGYWGEGDIYYDGNGNIVKQVAGDYRIEYTYDATQKLKSVTGNKSFAMSYDGWGNLTSRGDGQSYQFDSAGNLRWVNKGTPSQISYVYDAAGIRVLTNGVGQNKLEFTGLDGLLYFEKDLSLGTSINHLYMGRQKLVDVEAYGTATYFHNDSLGSPIAATDASGKLLWRTAFTPFGEKTHDGATGPIKNQQWFTGKPHEEATGLSYFGARWYDPVQGRFTAMDPVDWNEANPIHSFNRYAYANNNPFKFVDPDGRYAELAIEGVSISLGVKSLVANVRKGNYWAAAADALGVGIDSLAAAFPGPPGVIGLGIGMTRNASVASRFSIRGLDHGARHLVREGLISAPPNSKLARAEMQSIVEKLMQSAPVAKNYEMTRGDAVVDVYLGTVKDKQVAVYIAAQDTQNAKAGDIVTTITPSAEQINSYGKVNQ